MRLTASLLTSALCLAARLGSAFEVYTFDDPELPRDHPESTSRTLSPAEARLVLAQRAGVEDYHLDALLSPGGIDAINDFGSRASLFSQDGRQTRRCIILVESQVESWEDITCKCIRHSSPKIPTIPLKHHALSHLPPHSNPIHAQPNLALHDLHAPLKQRHSLPLRRPRSPESVSGLLHDFIRCRSHH